MVVERFNRFKNGVYLLIFNIQNYGEESGKNINLKENLQS